MAWSNPRSWTTGELVTAALANQEWRDNLLETTPAKVTTAGDLVYASGANTLARLGIGTARQVLQTNSAANAPEWAASPQSVLTAEADLLYASAANVLARLAKGTANQLLRMNADATAPEWMTAIWLPLAGGTMTGDTNFADKVVQRPELKDYAETSVAANSSTAYTVDLTTGNMFEITLTGNCVFTFSNPPASGKAGSFTLILKQDGTGGRTVTWPASVKWPGGEAPTISSDASAVDVLVFLSRDAGSTWYGMVAGQAFAVPA